MQYPDEQASNVRPHTPRPYSAPKLRLYGEVRTLTASGTGMIVEAGVEVCQPVTTRKHCK